MLRVKRISIVGTRKLRSLTYSKGNSLTPGKLREKSGNFDDKWGKSEIFVKQHNG